MIVKLPMVWDDRTAKRDRRQLKRRLSARRTLPPMPQHEDIPELEAS